MSPKVGDIAVCRHGIKGVITKIHTNPMSGTFYSGYQLDNPNKPWQSKYPEVIDGKSTEGTEATKSTT